MPLSDTEVATPAVQESTLRFSSHPAADLEHPWLGLESFDEETRAYFFGRDTEIAEIQLRLVSHPLLVLYGRSGLGKTSILKAGLIPRLQEERNKPASHRLGYKEEDPTAAEQLYYLLFYAHEKSGMWRYIEGISQAAQWWQTFRATIPFSLPDDFASRLWLRLHWRKQPPNITHLILDQFEEVFTLGSRRAGAEAEVRDALAVLIQSSIPPRILRLVADHDEFLDYFDPDSAPIRILLALRDDYVYALNRWKRSLPSLGQNNFELRALRGPAAFNAVYEPGALRCRYHDELKDENRIDTGLPPIVSKETAERIVRFVAKRSDDVPIEEIEAVPPILSLLCRELNERRFVQPRGTADEPAQQITFSEGETDVETIIKSFYERCVAGRPESIRIFIEEELVSYSGARLAQDEKSILTAFEKGWKTPGTGGGRLAPGYGDPVKARACLEDLVNQRLLASVTSGETSSYELIHDLLAGVVEKSRLTREALAEAERLRLEQAAQRRKQRVSTGIAFSLAGLLIFTIWSSYYAFVWEHREYYRDYAKRRGFPVGIFQISESEARKLPVSFRFVHKGITHDRWNIHWKPAFRVEVVNGSLELTTSHSMFPYLWQGTSEARESQQDKLQEKGERLGLKTVCQWEFVSTTKGEIIYERALDRAGRMVYGLIYSPSGTGSPDTRLTRFVGPDGFPQLQRDSAAEYVEIHYNNDGWEDRIMYRDSNNLAAAGPYGAFGRKMSHNRLGQFTATFSLDKDGRPMIDNSGNSGTQKIYNDKGYVIQETSLGTDAKPLANKDGLVIKRTEYDDFGRPRRITSQGINGEPVLSRKEGCHGWEIDYDERGNEVADTLLGLDGKPISIPDGYAAVKMDYDAHGQVTLLRLYDVQGKPTRSEKFGCHGVQMEYDNQCNQIVTTYLGSDRKPADIPDGYCKIKKAYDARGKLIDVRFYGSKDEPIVSKAIDSGYHGKQMEYDEHGNETVETYLGVDGQPMSIAAGYATFKTAYDARGRRIQAKFYGVRGEPVLSHQYGHGWQAEYDEQSKVIQMTYLGVDGKPAAAADGYAIAKMDYDANGNAIRETYYGAKGEPTLNYGSHGWEQEYDEHGNVTKTTYLGLDRKPVRTSAGYAIAKMDYDANGKKIRETYYGAKGEPTLSNGSHGWEAQYDQNGEQTSKIYFDLNGKPLR